MFNPQNITKGQALVAFAASLLLLSLALLLSSYLGSLISGFPGLVRRLINVVLWLIIVPVALVLLLLGMQRSTTVIALAQAAIWTFFMRSVPISWLPLGFVGIVLALRIVCIFVRPVPAGEHALKWQSVWHTFLHVTNAEYEAVFSTGNKKI